MKWREVVGKFIVLPDEEPGPPGENVAPTAVPTATIGTPLPPAASAPALLPAGDFDLSDIYKQEGISPGAFTAEQALEVLGSLPQELSLETQRQVFKELLRAKGMTLGVPPEVVLEDARRKIAVLTASVKSIPGQVADFVAASESEIT